MPSAIAFILHYSLPFSNLTRSPNSPQQSDTEDLEDGFYTYLTFLLIFLVFAIICCFALSYIIRCLESDPFPVTENPRKPDQSLPTLLFSEGIEMTGAEIGCAICLSEFVIGEEIRVLPTCKHGFHLQCIQSWLTSHSSCPTCRSGCLISSPAETQVPRENYVDIESPPELPVRQRVSE